MAAVAAAVALVEDTVVVSMEAVFRGEPVAAFTGHPHPTDPIMGAGDGGGMAADALAHSCPPLF